MKTKKIILYIASFGTLAFALIGIFRPDIFQRIIQREEVPTAEVRSLIPESDRPNGPVIVCEYIVWATEEAQRPIKFGNFETQYVTDRYWQDKPQLRLYPGKDMPSDEELLKILDPQEKGARVVAIVSKTKVKDSCQVYRFD